MYLLCWALLVCFLLQYLLVAREKSLGLLLGTFIMYLTFICFSIFHGVPRDQSLSSQKGAGGFDVHNPLDLGGMSCASDHQLFPTVVICFVLSLISFINLMWFDVDPGIVDTREEDFDCVSKVYC